MFYHMQMIARERQESLLREACAERMQRLAGERQRPVVYPARRRSRLAFSGR